MNNHVLLYLQGRRCGRPRKGEEKNKPVQAVPATCAKPEVPEQGKFFCM